jgi:hypothetical protein
MRKQFLTNVALDHDLLLEFFLTFARFEFALKASRFVGGDLRRAWPNWDSFGRSIDLDTARLDPNCAAAVDYFSLHPPWQQVVTTNGLAWDSTVSFATLDRMELVLELVRRGRNDFLLRHSLAVLHRCLELSPSVAANYDTASL